MSLAKLVKLGLIKSDSTSGKRLWSLTGDGLALAQHIKPVTPAATVNYGGYSNTSDGKLATPEAASGPASDFASSEIDQLPDYEPLTDADINAFLDLPVDFRSMLQFIHRAGYVAALKQVPDRQSVLDKFQDTCDMPLRAAARGI
jgi:hypothetical protein